MPVILAFQSNPGNAIKLGLDKEIREINGAIAPFARRDLKLIQLGAVNVSDLPHYLMEYKPDIFHFCGHGVSNGELVFVGDRGKAQPINNKSMELLFDLLGKNTKCVVLSSCFSKNLADRIAKYVPYVIGNSSAVRDDLATQFSMNFYRALSYGKNIEESFSIAKAVVTAIQKGSSNIPVMVSSKTVTPSQSILFNQAIVKASFELDKKKRPIKDGNLYELNVWVEHLPYNTLSVVYNFNHETIDDDIQEMLNDGSGTATTTNLYGNIQLRVTIWFNDEGLGIVTSLSDALENHYRGKKNNKFIKKALEDIKEN